MFAYIRHLGLPMVCGAALIVAAAWPVDASSNATSNRAPTGRATATRWHVAATRNFRIYSYGTRPLDAKVAARCESLRSDISSAWFGADADQQWSPKCNLVLHGTFAGYRAAVGTLASCTVAACSIESVGGAVATRRIDIRVDRPDWLEHLPHELTHMLADGRITTGQLPPWIDEGMALVADPAVKRAAHMRDLQDALRAGRQFRMTDLLAFQDYPRQSLMGAFYGQSLSVVEFLVDRGGREQFVAFVKQATREGYDAALRDTYGIRGLPELDLLWLAYVHGAAPSPRVATSESDRLNIRQADTTLLQPRSVLRAEPQVGLTSSG